MLLAAFFTRDALEQISRTTITSLTDLHNDRYAHNPPTIDSKGHLHRTERDR